MQIRRLYDTESSDAPLHFSSKLAKSPIFHMVLPFVLLNIHEWGTELGTATGDQPPRGHRVKILYRTKTCLLCIIALPVSIREPAGDGHRYASDTIFTFHYDGSQFNFGSKHPACACGSGVFFCVSGQFCFGVVSASVFFCLCCTLVVGGLDDPIPLCRQLYSN